jgi:hypothetical protein
MALATTAAEIDERTIICLIMVHAGVKLKNSLQTAGIGAAEELREKALGDSPAPAVGSAP